MADAQRTVFTEFAHGYRVRIAGTRIHITLVPALLKRREIMIALTLEDAEQMQRDLAARIDELRRRA